MIEFIISIFYTLFQIVEDETRSAKSTKKDREVIENMRQEFKEQSEQWEKLKSKDFTKDL